MGSRGGKGREKKNGQKDKRVDGVKKEEGGRKDRRTEGGGIKKRVKRKKEGKAEL
jgi:hypothetical protein